MTTIDKIMSAVIWSVIVLVILTGLVGGLTYVVKGFPG